MPRLRMLLASYLVGLAACSVSQTIVDKRWLYYRIPAPTNGLLMAKFVIAGLIEKVVESVGTPNNNGTHAEAIFLAISVAAVAALFPLAVWLLWHNRNGLRLQGAILAMLLLLMTFWWFDGEM